MSAVEPVMRRVRKVVGTAGNERFDATRARLVLRAVLFDGDGPPDWHRAAACAATDREVFFTTAGNAMSTAAAKRVCRSCPVRVACLADVMAWEAPTRRHGVVGGLSASERTRLHQSRRARAAGEPSGPLELHEGAS